LIAYIHKGVSSVEILPEILGPRITLFWTNPRTGATYSCNNRVIHSPDFTLIVAPPDTNDWLLLMTNPVVSIENTPTALPAFNISGLSWSSSQVAVFNIECAQRGVAYLNICDMLGRYIARVSSELKPGTNSIPVSLAASGMHLYNITYITCDGVEYAKTGKLIKY
jgi:hypothetical protein